MIEIRKINFAYSKKQPIFKDLSLEIGSGIYGLLGENGVGKTTLLHLIAGLRFPENGSCRVLGYESMERNPQMLSQIYYLSDEDFKIKESISQYAQYNSGFYPHFDKESFEKYLSDFQVEGNKPMSELSLGQCKKAMIAFALALNTPILLLDEPTNGLDIQSKKQFKKLISQQTEDHRCIIISTHQAKDIENLISHAVIIRNNKVLLNSSVNQILEKLHFSYSLQKPSDALYYEQFLQGYISVKENLLNEESMLNLEALFSVTTSNEEKIREIFKNKLISYEQTI